MSPYISSYLQGGAWVFEGENELFAHLDYSSGETLTLTLSLCLSLSLT
jgi:hypothetical protein